MFTRRLLFNGAGGGSGQPTTLEFDIDQPGGSSLPDATVAIGALYVMAAVKAFQFIKKKLGKSEDETALEYNQRRQNLYIYIPKRGYIRDLNHDCSELLYTDKEHEAKVFMYIDGIRGVLSYMKLVKNAGVTLPDYYIVTNGVKEEVAKIHF